MALYKINLLTSSFIYVIYILVVLSSSSKSVVQAGDVLLDILEEQEVGALVGKIIDQSGLYDKYSEDIVSQMQYSILSDSGDADTASYFNVGTNDGVLTIKKVIDREDVCLYLDDCILVLSVAARVVQPPQYFESITVRVNVIDINDNAPRFPKAVENLLIPENTDASTSFPLLEAIDNDSGANGVQSYSLKPQTTKFGISTNANPDGSMGIQLIIVEKLDREVKDNYKLYLWASDAGDPVFNASVVINITVGDSNDNIATFEQVEYSADVMEDLDPPAVIITVKANDNDLGDAGNVIYSFSTKTTALYGDIFQINAQSGEISLLQHLDYETIREYSLTLTARDSAPNARMSQATVKIYVHDVNDFTPQITVNTLTNNGQAEVPENAVLETFVAHISVIDRDSRLNGLVQCQLDSYKFSLQKIQDTQYKLVTAYILDRETESLNEITITCYDHGSPSLNSSKTVQVSILDENDNSPEFTEENYNIIIQENNPAEVYITTVKAVDKDYGVNARVTYSFVNNRDNNVFTIDPNTGVIKAVRSMDYEQQHEIELHVLATDGGSASVSATAVVLIELLDLNDNAPKFSQPNGQFNFIIVENQPAYTDIGLVQARDADSPPFDVVEYKFVLNSMQNLFKLNSRTGMLSSKVEFDRESQSLYEFQVMAFNPDSPSISSVATVFIYIEDDNDWSPIITFPNVENHTLAILQTTEAGDIITQVAAHDPDDGNNAWLSYYITSGNQGGYFIIGLSSGFITVTKDISQSQQIYFNLTIEVSDNGSPPRVSHEWILIALNATILDEGFPANMAILVSLVSITGIVMILLLVAILWLLYKSKYRTSPHSKYDNSLDDSDDKTPPPVEIIKRLDTSQIHVDLNSSFKEPSVYKKPLPHTVYGNSQNSSDSGFEEVTISPHGKLVSFRTAGPSVQVFKPNSAEKQQDSDSNSAHSEDGSNTDSGCVLSETGADDSYRLSMLDPNCTNSPSKPQQPTHPGYIVMKNTKSPPVIVYPANTAYGKPRPHVELDNKIMYNSKLDNMPNRQKVIHDITPTKEKMKKVNFSNQSNWPDLCIALDNKLNDNCETDMDMIAAHRHNNHHNHLQHIPSFTDSSSLFRYKTDPNTLRCASEATDDASESTTSGSYIIQGSEDMINCSGC